MEARNITIFDTSLRDGEQAPSNSMSPEGKVHLAVLLEAMGVSTIETGFPASSPAEAKATELISKKLSTASFATFCRAVRRDVDIAVEAGGTARHQVQVLATASDLHLRYKREISRRDAVDEVRTAVAHAKSLGVESVSVALEDASRGDDDLLRAIIEAGAEAGATVFGIPDTSGCMTPSEYGELIGRVREWAPRPLKVSVHCHDDFGLSTINTVAGLQAGADEAQTTLGGIGERAGNAAMEEVVALLAYKSESLGVRTEIDTTQMYAAYTDLRQIIGLAQPRNKAIFGTYCFGTAAGIHQQGVLRNPATYEYVEPARFGRERTLMVARHSGRSILRYLLDEMGVSVDGERLDDLYRRHICERSGNQCEEISVLRARLSEELLPVAA